MPKAYVVFVGRQAGVYDKWSEANSEVYRFPGACFKGYETRKEAEDAFQSYLKKQSLHTSCSKTKFFTSNPNVTGENERKPCKKQGDLMQAIADLTRENLNLAKKMEKNSEEIAMFLEKMDLRDEQ